MCTDAAKFQKYHSFFPQIHSNRNPSILDAVESKILMEGALFQITPFESNVCFRYQNAFHFAFMFFII